MRTPFQLGAVLWVCILLVAGCRLMDSQPDFESHSLLKPATPSPNSVKMEIIWARFPANDPGLNDDAWREIDETQLDPAVHRELANNGLRVGVINGKLPDALSRALGQNQSSLDESPPVDGEMNELLADPIVHGRIVQMPRDKRYEVTASNVYAAIPLLIRGPNGLGGRTYANAQAIYAMRVDPQPDQTALLELTPELHYGEARMRMIGGDEGAWHQAMQRDREVFDRLRMNVRLGPGDMLVVMGLPDAGSRLGHYFHTVESSDGPQPKLILIRLADMPQSDTFASFSE